MQSSQNSGDHWIKAEYNKKIKRIFNPPKDYENFIDVLRARFSDLHQDLIDDPTSSAHLKFYDMEGDLINVETSRDLQESYLYYSKHSGQRLLKFIIDLYEDPPR
jgi:hypothetical protein